MSKPKDGHTYVRVCFQCGTQFEEYHPRQYCSEPCRKKLASARQLRNYHRRRAEDPTYLNDYRAKQREENKEAYRKRQREWAQKWRKENPEAAAALSRKNQLRYAQNVRVKEARRRARKRGAFVEDVAVEVLFKRDLGICGICREPVDPDLCWPNQKSKTVDHIRPLARGGLHSYANTQLAHAGCNIRKGARTGTMPTNQASDARDAL